MQKPPIKLVKFCHWEIALEFGPGSRQCSPSPQSRLKDRGKENTEGHERRKEQREEELQRKERMVRNVNGRNGMDGGKNGRKHGGNVNDRGRKGIGRRDARQGRKETHNEGT